MKSRAKLAASKAVKGKTSKKPVKGFIQVNMAKWDEKEIRAICRAVGWQFRGFLRYAIIRYRRELEEHIRLARLCGVKPDAHLPFPVVNKNN